jgi:hypothetical protein
MDSDNKASRNKEFVIVKKTEEEIKKLMIEESVSEIERAVIILEKGQQIQKPAVYNPK